MFLYCLIFLSYFHTILTCLFLSYLSWHKPCGKLTKNPNPEIRFLIHKVWWHKRLTMGFHIIEIKMKSCGDHKMVPILKRNRWKWKNEWIHRAIQPYTGNGSLIVLESDFVERWIISYLFPVLLVKICFLKNILWFLHLAPLIHPAHWMIFSRNKVKYYFITNFFWENLKFKAYLFFKTTEKD